MSEQVTWEVCLRCGHLAAVGWVAVLPIGSARGEGRPVEFDCPAGCQVGLDELAQAYVFPAPGSMPGSAGEPR